MPTGSEVYVGLFQQLVYLLLRGVVVVSGGGQAVAAIGSVAPQASDDLAGKLVHGLLRDSRHQLKVGGVHGAADGVFAVLAAVDNDPRAVSLHDVPVLRLHPGGDGLAAVVLRTRDLHEVALFEGRGRLRIGFLRLGGNRRLLIRRCKAVQLRALDDGGIVLVGDIGIHVAGDAVHAALGGVLPHTESAVVGRSGSPLHQSVIEPLQPGIVQAVLQPVEVAVQGAEETGLLDGVAESDDHVGQHGLSEILPGLVLEVEGDGIGEHALVLFKDAHHVGGFLLGGGHGGRVGIEVAADLNAGLHSPLHVPLEPAVQSAGGAVSGTVAETDHGELHAGRLDLRPVDLALPL